MKKRKNSWWKILLFVLLTGNAALYFSGKWYWYKALVYNFVDIDDLNLFPSRIVSAGNPQPWYVGSDYNQLQLGDSLMNAMKKYRTVAFLIVKDDSIRFEKYFENYGKGSLSNSFSMAKSIIGTLVGIAIDEGKIKSIDQAVCDFLPEFCSAQNQKLTIRHLLTMSSGLDYDEGYSSLFSPTTRSYYDTDLRGQMSELKVVSSPGKEFNYMSCNTQLLAFILQKATQMSVSEYASVKLWKPIGAEHDAMWSLDHNDGDEKAYCCFYSDARDFARLGKLYLNFGRWNGKQIVSESWVKQSTSPAPLSDDGKPNKNYGFHWWTSSDYGTPVYYARGILGQYIIVLPSKKIIIVRLGHERGEKGSDDIPVDLPLYIREVLKMYPD